MESQYLSRVEFVDDFLPERFEPIQNHLHRDSGFPKPHGGLWSVLKPAEGQPNPWQLVVEASDFPNQVVGGFDFMIPESARVLRVETENDVEALSGYVHGTTYDWEAIATDYDVFHIRGAALGRDEFIGWDIESVLVMQPDMVTNTRSVW